MSILRPGLAIRLTEDCELKKSIIDFKGSAWTQGPRFDPKLVEYTKFLRQGDVVKIEKMGKKQVKLDLVSGVTIERISEKWLEIEQDSIKYTKELQEANLILLDKFLPANKIWSINKIEYFIIDDSFPKSIEDVDRVEPLWSINENKDAFIIERETAKRQIQWLTNLKPKPINEFTFVLSYGEFDKLKYIIEV